jgi:hypothetical protein
MYVPSFIIHFFTWARQNQSLYRITCKFYNILSSLTSCVGLPREKVEGKRLSVWKRHVFSRDYVPLVTDWVNLVHLSPFLCQDTKSERLIWNFYFSIDSGSWAFSSALKWKQMENEDIHFHLYLLYYARFRRNMGSLVGCDPRRFQANLT